MIEFIKLNKSYHNKNKTFNALSDINFKINQGEIFGILGQSGAGKSTLLRCINLLVRPTSGHVLINGCNITELDRKSLQAKRQKIGIIFQHFNLLESQTAFENIALPLKLQNKTKVDINQRVNALLELVDLSDKKEALPKALSGGQKQRVAIARALASEPEILLCDEATSALDPESTQNVLALLKKINQALGITITLITHELEVVKSLCDRVALLHEGQLIECSDTFSLFSDPKHSVTKNLVNQAFVAAAQQHEIKSSKHFTVRLTFVGKDSDLPLISQLIKQFNLTVNILCADITKVQGKTIGYTLCEFLGSEEQISQSLSFIQSTSIKLEILNHG